MTTKWNDCETGFITFGNPSFGKASLNSYNLAGVPFITYVFTVLPSWSRCPCFVRIARSPAWASLPPHSVQSASPSLRRLTAAYSVNRTSINQIHFNYNLLIRAVWNWLAVIFFHLDSYAVGGVTLPAKLKVLIFFTEFSFFLPNFSSCKKKTQLPFHSRFQPTHDYKMVFWRTKLFP